MKTISIMTFIVMLSANIYAQADTVSFSNNNKELLFPNQQKINNYVVPTILVSYGLVTLSNNSLRNLDFRIHSKIRDKHPNFVAHVDDYLQYSPLLAMYFLDILGVEGKNKVLDQTAMVLVTTGITTAIVTPLKTQTHRSRPTGAHNSFPSGHTATAFAAAEMLNQEFKENSSWYGYAGYSIAATTGILRMYNNKHWLSDVVTGAGIGILSTKFTYVVYPYLKKIIGTKHKNTLVMPSYNNGALQLYLNSKF